ncbi:MAG: hypothetical protein PHF50_01495 [Patescibacteria group bacterium]|nr:hypothetical protein [Patescibacteria group bacterium]
MEKVVDLSTFQKRQRKEKEREKTLTELLKEATILRQGMEEIKEAVKVVDFEGLRRVFDVRLSNIVLTKRDVGVDFFLCGNYVATLLTEAANAPPESWYAVDYFIRAEEENDPAALRQGANVCFLIYAVFPPRGQIRCMRLDDYEAMGRSMYYGYYGQTGTVVAYYMSQQFKPMAEITKECVKELK